MFRRGAPETLDHRRASNMKGARQNFTMKLA
jgi:hypothetical protein